MFDLLIALQLAVVQPPVDLSGVPSKTDLANVQAAVPPICSTAPPPDASTATAGTGAPCTHRADAASQTGVMPSSTTTLADGTFSGTWPGTFTTAPTTAMASAKTTADPYTCQVGAAAVNGYSGKCWKQAQVLTLPSTAVALLNLQLTTAAAAPAGITVMVVGRQ